MMPSVKRRQVSIDISVLTNSTVHVTHASKKYYFEFERNTAGLPNSAFIGHMYAYNTT